MTPVAVGVIGGFTTFSTFVWEGFTFGRTGRAGRSTEELTMGRLRVLWGALAAATTTAAAIATPAVLAGLSFRTLE